MGAKLAVFNAISKMSPKLWLSVLFYIVSVHVKTDLPHSVGTEKRTHTFTVWVEDSCYHRVTGTVTITTYNVVSYHGNTYLHSGFRTPVITELLELLP